jgi:hypothetical protein
LSAKAGACQFVERAEIYNDGLNYLHGTLYYPLSHN